MISPLKRLSLTLTTSFNIYSSHQMPFLTDLPNELLSRIFSCLIIPDLARTSRVSHRIRAVVEPFLYRETYLASDKIHHLLRTLLSRPSLRSYLRSYFAAPRGLLGTNFHPQTAEEVAMFTTAAHSFKLELPMENAAAQLILLLYLLPNLQELNLGGTPYESWDFQAFMDAQAYLSHDTLPIGLHSLRQFCGGGWGYNGAPSPEAFVALLMLPSIRIIEERMVEDNTIDHLDIDKFAGKSTVKMLKFSYSEITALSLARILKMPCALTHFSYSHTPMGRELNINGRGIEVALRPLRPTLEYLELKVVDPWSDGNPSPVGVFRDWPVLRTVSATMSALLGHGGEEVPLRLVDVLPAVIHEFEMVCGDHWELECIEGQVIKLLELKDLHGLNQLNVIRVGPSYYGDGVMMKTSCAAAGVNYVHDSSEVWQW